jgi:O-antigen ligase
LARLRQNDLTGLSLLFILALAFYVAPWPPVYVPALAGVVIIAWFRLDLALTLVVGFCPAFMEPKHIGAKVFAPSEIFLLVDLAIVSAYALSRTRRSTLDFQALRRSPFLTPALLFLAAATLSTVLAADRPEAFRAYREIVVEPLLWFTMLLLVQRTGRGWLLCIGALLASGALVAVIAIGQFFTHHGVSVTTGSTLIRARALYGSPDNLGLFFDRVVPLWLAIALLAGWSRRRRLGWLLVGGILGLALLFTFSRGAWLAIGVACLALVWQYSWGRRLALAVGVFAAAAALYKGPQIAIAFHSGHANTTQQRLHIWQSGARMVRDHPVVGIGPDNFQHYYAPGPQLYLPCKPGLGYMDVRAHDEPCLSHPHNEVLDFWLSTGILGLGSMSWLLLTFWRTAFQLYQRTQGADRILLGGVMASVLASLLHGLVDNSYFLVDLALIFWLFCAFVSHLATAGVPDAAG